MCIASGAVQPDKSLLLHPRVDVDEGKIKDLGELDVYDLYSTKWWALKFATEAAVTVMRVDQIIMAKQAGGPKPRGGPGDDDD